MELNDLKVLTVLGMVTLLATGCGNDGNNVQSEVVPPDLQQPESSPLDDQVIQSGRFLDSAVMGLAYSTPTQHGFTDIDGTYHYLDGESVAFYLGNPQLPGGHAWKLGDTTAREVVTPLELLGTDTVNQQVRNILRLLQSLDVDGDPSNGIELSTDDTNLPDGNLLLDLSLSDSEFEIDPVIRSYLVHASITGDLVTAQTAIDHFQGTLNELLDIPVGTWIYTHGTIDGIAIPDLTASIQFEDDTHYSAQYAWTGDNGAVSADYSINGMNFNSEVVDFYLNSGGETIHQYLDDTLQRLPESMHDMVNVVLAVDANLRVLPNSIVLESDDGSVVLHYARGETAGDGTVAYLEINSPSVVSSEIGDVLQLEAVARAPSSAIISPVQISWSTSDSTIATVNGNGQVIAVGSGSVTVQASAAGIDVSIQIEVSMENNIPTVEVDTTDSANNTPDSENITADNENNGGNEEVQPVATEPEKCPEGQVSSQSNEEHVSQQNTSSVNQSSIEQSNQQTVQQQNSSDECVPVRIVEVFIPDIEF